MPGPDMELVKNAESEDEPLVQPHAQGLQEPHHVKMPFSVKMVIAFASVLGVGLAARSQLGSLRSQAPAPVAPSAEMGVVSKAEVDTTHYIPGYTEYAHVNCFEHRGGTSAGLPEVRVVVKSVSQCAVHCNRYPGRCSGFVIFYRYRPFQCWLRSAIAKDKGLCQQNSKDVTQDAYHFATYQKLHGVETSAFSGTMSFQGKCMGVTEPKDGSIITLNECGCADCWVHWEAKEEEPGSPWKIFRLGDFPTASVSSFRLKGTDKCLDVHDHADWRKNGGLDTKMNYLQLWTCGVDQRSRKDQKWIVLQSPDKISFQLQWLTDPRLGLDVPMGQNTVGNHIQIYKFLMNWPNQVFESL